MNDSNRKMSDILLSLEGKLTSLIEVISASDHNQKLMLDRLNTLVKGAGVVSSSTPLPSIPAAPPPTLMELSPKPTAPSRRQQSIQPMEKEPKREISKPVSFKSSGLGQGKIPVGQRISDNNGKDLFMAEVSITDLATQEVVSTSKTNATGKWQAYLPAGRYSIYVSKAITADSKIEAMQEVEITPQMKSLQLPTAIIKR